MEIKKIKVKKKTFLIAGGAGFIGYNLSMVLLKLGHRVIIIDDFSTNIVENIDHNIKTYKTNIGSIHKVKNIFEKEKPNIVYYLAGIMDLKRKITSPLFIKNMNILGTTKIILDSCLANNTEKIIFISSGGAIYENAKTIPTTEDYLPHPTSIYGLANLMIEKYVMSYYEEYGLNFTILRLSNSYGPMQSENRIIPLIIAKVLKKERPVIYGDGNQTRDFLYINDAIEALIMAEKGDKGIYNVGIGKEVSLNEIFEIVASFSDFNLRPVYKKLNIPEAKRSALDIKKMKKDFNWRPKTDIEEGLKKTVKWYKSTFNL